MNDPHRPRICPDCPATRARLLVPLAEQASGCAFRCLSLAAREPLPSRWQGEYGLALVRRGIIIRQRVDALGRATAIDIAGPGSAFPLGPEDDPALAAYAVDDAMLCLLPTRTLETTLQSTGQNVASDVVRAQSMMLSRVERIAEARGRSTSNARVASLLVTIADTLSPSQRLSVVPAAIQQRDLAALLALRHESVCRSVASLVRDHAIERTRSGLRIADRSALEAA